MVVPAPLRKRLAVENGGPVMIHDENGVLTIESIDDAVRRAQALVRIYDPDGKGIVDELIADRRAEAARE